MFTFDDYQKETNKTAIYPKEKAVEYLVLGLTSEAGEVAGKLKKVIRDKGGVIGDEEKHALASEVGDVLWYISQIAYELDMTMSELAAGNVEKLSSRQKRGVIGGSGDSR
jgi:NTP pyrophosphatase (non-canonical NTP hydrolase)